MKTLIYLRPTFIRWVWWLIVIFRITLLFWTDGVDSKSAWFINLFKKLNPNLVGQIHKEDANMNFYWVLKSPEWALWGLGWHLRPRKNDYWWDNINFVDNPEDLGIILNKIDAELNGLF
jgi:hypothetical protein